MHIKDNIVNFLYDKNYFISLYDNNIFVFNYANLKNFSDRDIDIDFDNFNLLISGKNLLIKKMGKSELLISGDINNLKISK